MLILQAWSVTRIEGPKRVFKIWTKELEDVGSCQTSLLFLCRWHQNAPAAAWFVRLNLYGLSFGFSTFSPEFCSDYFTFSTSINHHLGMFSNFSRCLKQIQVSRHETSWSSHSIVRSQWKRMKMSEFCPVGMSEQGEFLKGPVDEGGGDHGFPHVTRQTKY